VNPVGTAAVRPTCSAAIAASSTEVFTWRQAIPLDGDGSGALRKFVASAGFVVCRDRPPWREARPPKPVPRSHKVRYTCSVTEIVPGITADPARAFGKPVIAGTRVPAATVLGLLAAGRSEAEIFAEYDLTSEQIRAVLRYAAWLASQQSLRAS